MEVQPASVGSPLLWGGFLLFVVAMLLLDLGVFHRRSHAVRYKEALIWSGVWVSLALAFALGIYARFGTDHAVEFLTGYLIEKSLSVDNIFVFLVIFSVLGIPAIHQHRVLFWGIFTALVLRALLIVAGAALLERFHWLMYVFGGFLVLSGVKLFLERNKQAHPERGWALQLLRRVVPSTPELEGSRFLVKRAGRWLATPLLLSLLLVEVSDVMFAVDSIPAIFSVTEDAFLVFTSNIFAILGLRSLFFLVAGLVAKFTYLKVGLSGVLVFVGAKMGLASWVHLNPFVSLAVIAALLGASIAASLLVPAVTRESASQTP